MMRVNWNCYTAKGKAEGITQLNECILAWGTEDDCKDIRKEHIMKHGGYSSGSYNYNILPSITKPNMYCLHIVWNGYYD